MSVYIKCDVDHLMLETEKSYTPQYTNWVKCSDTDIINNKATTHILLSDITIPIDAIHCTDTNCSLHTANIECFYDNIVYSLNKSADICLKTSKCSSSANHNVPGWNDYVKDQHNLARDAFLLWRNSGKPRQGVWSLKEPDLNMLLGIVKPWRKRPKQMLWLITLETKML